MEAGFWLQTEELAFENGIAIKLTRRTLVASSLEAVQEVQWPRRYFQRAAGDQMPEAVLRTLLVCALAAGYTGSQEIASAIPDAPVLKYLATGFAPQFQTIHDFRRRNHETIRTAVALALEKCLSAISIPSRCPDVQAETAARLDRAIRADSMALDL